MTSIIDLNKKPSVSFDNNYINLYEELPKDWVYQHMYDHLINGGSITNGEQTISFNPLTSRGNLSCQFGCCNTIFKDWFSICSYLNDDWDSWTIVDSQEPQPL